MCCSFKETSRHSLALPLVHTAYTPLNPNLNMGVYFLSLRKGCPKVANHRLFALFNASLLQRDSFLKLMSKFTWNFFIWCRHITFKDGRKYYRSYQEFARCLSLVAFQDVCALLIWTGVRLLKSKGTVVAMHSSAEQLQFCRTKRN